jgi:hypothetical protein
MEYRIKEIKYADGSTRYQVQKRRFFLFWIYEKSVDYDASTVKRWLELTHAQEYITNRINSIKETKVVFKRTIPYEIQD